MTRWDGFLQGTQAVWWAAALLAIAVLISAWVLLAPSRAIPVSRRRYGVTEAPTTLARAAEASTGLIDRVLRSRGRLDSMAHALDLAGIRRSVPEFTLLVGAAALVGAAIGMVLGDPFIAFVLAAMAIAGAVIFVSFRAGERRTDFSDQLDDVVQLLGSNLRAGHSVLQALDSVSRELDEPASGEIARVVNQVRVGRDLGDALDDAASRMDSDDFRWISQAVAIHRQVGGNLAEVMDTVGETIRERNAIRRQVKALAAEGKISAYVLIALPFAVALIFQIVNPGYIGLMTQSALGYAMILLALVLLAAGSWWLSRLVKIKF